MDDTQMPEAAPQAAAPELEGFNPDAFIASGGQTATAAPANMDHPDLQGFDPDSYLKDLKEEKYSTPGQMLKTAAEGAAEGIAGPLATGIEKHVLGVDPEEMLNRREVNPGTHGIAQGIGLGASLFTGVGEGALLAKAGQGVLESAGLGAKALEGASLLSKIGAEAIDQGVQQAIFQGGDEVSKMIINDPNTTAESAIANVGLAGALGGTIGAGIGAISPLFKSTLGEPTAKLITEMKDRYAFRQGAGDIAETAGKEFQNVVAANENVTKGLYSDAEGGLKGQLLSKSMPEVSEKATMAIQDEAQAVSDKMSKAIERMGENKKIGGQVGKLEQDLIDFQTKVTKPNASYADTFEAVDDLKRTLQGYSKYSHTGVAESEFATQAKKLAAELKLTLENEAVWGKAAGVQKDVNKLVSEFLSTQKDTASKFMTTVGGEKVFDPAKMATYIKQAGSAKAEIKGEILKEFLDKSENLHKGINKIFNSAGIEQQVDPVSLNVLRDTLGEKTAGSKVMDSIIDKLGDNVAGRSAAAGLGAGIGGPVGALVGEHLLGHQFTKALGGLTKFLVESPVSAAGFRSAADFAIAAAKGQSMLNKAVGSVFKAGSMVIPSHLMPSDKDREKLDKVVTQLQKDPEGLAKVNNGEINHYMPNHAAALSQSNAQAVAYLNQIKPRPYRSSPLDKEIQPSIIEKARYDRALNIAQQPAIVLEHVKQGTLQQSDIVDLTSMYPQLYRQMRDKLSNEIANVSGSGAQVPYKTRMSLGLFLGNALDTTMQPMSIVAAQPKPPQQQQGQGKAPGASRNTSKLGETNSSYQTPLQAAAEHKASRKH